MVPKFHKTRIAPTPSGFLHTGNAMSFILTADMARETGAGILLRIDDLDRQRVTDEYVQDIFDTLAFLDIKCDEGPHDLDEYKKQWSQVHRLSLYNDALTRLCQTGKVYACTCSRTEIDNCVCFGKKLPLDGPNIAWRLRTPAAISITVKTLMQGIIQTPLPPEMRDFVIRKKDGYPAYQLASMVDDLHFGIDLVVRGEDLWPSTIAQHYIAQLLYQDQFAAITFHHHPLITGDDKIKLSKSAGATSIRYMRQPGLTKEDVLRSLPRV